MGDGLGASVVHPAACTLCANMSDMLLITAQTVYVYGDVIAPLKAVLHVPELVVLYCFIIGVGTRRRGSYRHVDWQLL